MIRPLLISVPHGGRQIPPEVAKINRLSLPQIIKDGDEGANEIYSFAAQQAEYVTTSIARAFVDVNRAEDDWGRDGAVKTHTIWEEPIYRQPLPPSVIEDLLEKYHRPYHHRLATLAPRVKLGIDCHTMAAVGPPCGPLAGQERPFICLSNGEGTCPDTWMTNLAECLQREFDYPVSINFPFRGGYIIRAHAAKLPWVQLELSRSSILSIAEKRAKIQAALAAWCAMTFGSVDR